MAEGAATLTKRWAAKPEWGALKKMFLTLTLGADGYNTGGYTCDLTYFGGLDTVRMVHLPNLVIATAKGYVPDYDEENKKLLFYRQDTTDPAAADSGLIEIPDGSTLLNGVEVYIAVEGNGV